MQAGKGYSRCQRNGNIVSVLERIDGKKKRSWKLGDQLGATAVAQAKCEIKNKIKIK